MRMPYAVGLCFQGQWAVHAHMLSNSTIRKNGDGVDFGEASLAKFGFRIVTLERSARS